MRKAWYDAAALNSVRTVQEVRNVATDWRSRRRSAQDASVRACLLYPLRDGPGVALLVFMPPVLFFLSLPVFDWISIVDPFRRADWALGLLVLPIFLPLLFSFSMCLGYTLLILGQMLVSSALGEPDHPRWPEWNPATISEGIGRWLWAAVFGVVLGGIPCVVYWIYCGTIDWVDRIIFADLVILGVGYAQMTLAAALLHEQLIAANPILVFSAIGRIGWDYVRPCLAGGLAVLLGAGILWAVLFRMPTLKLAAAGLWGFWVFGIYEAMVVLRMLGLTYHARAVDLVWFRKRPRWTTSTRSGQLYSNS